jgi:hypothetical protein
MQHSKQLLVYLSLLSWSSRLSYVTHLLHLLHRPKAKECIDLKVISHYFVHKCSRRTLPPYPADGVQGQSCLRPALSSQLVVPCCRTCCCTLGDLSFMVAGASFGITERRASTVPLSLQVFISRFKTDMFKSSFP